MKKCVKCGRELPEEAFYAGKTMCKECWSAYQKEYREAKKSAGIPPRSSEKAVMEFLGGLEPRLLIKALYLRGYRGELTYVETRRVSLAKIGEEK